MLSGIGRELTKFSNFKYLSQTVTLDYLINYKYTSTELSPYLQCTKYFTEIEHLRDYNAF